MVRRQDFGLWVCHECKKDFLFESDVEDHIKMAGHREIRKYDLNFLEEQASEKN